MNIKELTVFNENGISVIPEDVYSLQITHIDLLCKGHLEFFLKKRFKKLFEKNKVAPDWYACYATPGGTEMQLNFSSGTTCLPSYISTVEFAKSEKGKNLIVKAIKSAYADYMLIRKKMNISEEKLVAAMLRILPYTLNPDLIVEKNEQEGITILS